MGKMRGQVTSWTRSQAQNLTAALTQWEDTAPGGRGLGNGRNSLQAPVTRVQGQEAGLAGPLDGRRRAWPLTVFLLYHYGVADGQQTPELLH